MNPLFWKFWMATTLAIVSMLMLSWLLSTQWYRFALHDQTQSNPQALIQGVADRLEGLLRNRQDPTPVLLNNEMSVYGHTYLIGPTGSDWLNRPIPPEILSSTPTTQMTTVENRPTLFARAIFTPDGSPHFMIFQFKTRQNPIWFLFRRYGWTWLVVGTVLVSSLVAGLLALYVANPLRRLARVSKRLGEGKFSVHIDDRLLLRRDEIGALARQLKLSAEETRDALARQQELVRDVSHEVRTPLARLQLAAESLELCPTDEHAHRQMHREINHIDKLVHSLLHLNRGVDKHRVPVCLPDLLRERISQARIVAEQKNLSVGLQLPVRNPVIQADPDQLGQAVENLLSNAIRHSPEGAGIEIRCEQTARGYEITVADEGMGVPVQCLEAIFEPFVRLDHARERNTGGFGVGLALVKKIATQHQGRVWAQNRTPHGLAVTLMLPLETLHA